MFKNSIVKNIILGVAIIMGVGMFSGCDSGQEVEFERGMAFGNGGERTITKIVDSLDDLSDSDIAGVISIDEKYDAEFFANNSLIIVSFATKTDVESIDEIRLTKKSGGLHVEVIGTQSTRTMIGGVLVALEVTKENIDGAKIVKLTTNLNKI